MMLLWDWVLLLMIESYSRWLSPTPDDWGPTPDDWVLLLMIESYSWWLSPTPDDWVLLLMIEALLLMIHKEFLKTFADALIHFQLLIKCPVVVPGTILSPKEFSAENICTRRPKALICHTYKVSIPQQRTMTSFCPSLIIYKYTWTRTILLDLTVPDNNHGSYDAL